MSHITFIHENMGSRIGVPAFIRCVVKIDQGIIQHFIIAGL